jgi:hypothetical protein
LGTGEVAIVDAMLLMEVMIIFCMIGDLFDADESTLWWLIR